MNFELISESLSKQKQQEDKVQKDILYTLQKIEILLESMAGTIHKEQRDKE
ncbi:hypothetical protein ABFV99_00565 [Cytobacillus horneckiae]|uniref:hypothetical protein n=1 Tax=Cytobacillus horneckiae TaxID=549687 RepID=UPI0034CDA430